MKKQKVSDKDICLLYLRYMIMKNIYNIISQNYSRYIRRK